MKAIVLGASGLIGTELMRMLSADPEVESVRIVTRRPLNVDLPKLEERVIELGSTEQMEGVVEKGALVFSCIGTTLRQVKGDRDAYRKIDHAITLRAGQACLKKGASCFSFVSSGGANARSSNFYLRLKGEIEEDAAALGLPSLVIMQPSLLLGKRSVFRPENDWLSSSCPDCPFFSGQFQTCTCCDRGGSHDPIRQENAFGMYHRGESEHLGSI